MADEVKKFGSAAKKAFSRDEAEMFARAEVAGKEMEFAYPGNGAIVYMVGELASVEAAGAADLEAVGGLLQFIYIMLSNEDSRHIRHSLLSPTVDFDEDDVVALLKYLTEEWADGRPTERPSDSSRRPAATGRPSTAGARRRE